MSKFMLSNAARSVTPIGILVQKLGDFLERAKHALNEDSLIVSLQEVYALAAGIDPYLEQCTTQDSSALSALVQKTVSEDWNQRYTDGTTVRQLEQEMLSGHLEGQTLKMFVHMTRSKRILEIGMFTGYSALAMAEALPEDGCLIACEVDRYVADFAQSCFDCSPYGHKIKVKVAPALKTLQDLAKSGETFDFVFIDADKREYLEYFNILLDGSLLAPNGVICVDNTLFQGQPYLPPKQRTANGDAIAEFNRAIADDPRVDQVLLPVRDGLTIIRRK